MNYRNTGMSVMEISHRAAPIVELIEEVEQKIRRLLHLPNSSAVLLLQGGGSLQFCMVPMNLSVVGDPVDYVDTDYWTLKAIEAGKSLGRDVHISACDHEGIPQALSVRSHAKYLHICTNNTVVGTQWHTPPNVTTPLVADMSSDFLSRPHDVAKYDLLYAHAQKTLGTSGVTVVVASQRVLENIPDRLPAFFDYRTHAKAKSNYHTPPVFAIYVMNCMLDWLEHDIGGLENMGALNDKKAHRLYEFLDHSQLFHCAVAQPFRSQMNVVFDINRPDLAKSFSDFANENGLVGLDGHRSRGGFRASLYNAVTIDDVNALVDFMSKFEEQHHFC
jgi:phosphoserine aminotransferase